MPTTVSEFVEWLNANQGVLTLLIFVITLILGWTSGVFTALMRKPNIRIELLKPGPTFSCTFPTGEQADGHDIHRTAIALYLRLSNVGSAPTNVVDVSIGYHWHLKPFSAYWLRYRIFWYWIRYQVVALDNFQVLIGDFTKVYPFLVQRNLDVEDVSTYLEIGQSVNGVVYFEQPDSWGGCFPSPHNGQTKIIVAISDTFGRRYRRRFNIPVVSLEEGKKYNASFGETWRTLQEGSNSARKEQASIEPNGGA